MGQNSFKKYPLPPQAGYSIFGERTMIFNTKFNEDKRMREALVDTKIITEAQLNTILKYSQLEEYPEALNTLEKLTTKKDDSKRSKYKTYWIGSWTEFFPKVNNFRQMHLIWIPKDENSWFDNEYTPKTDEGFYIITSSLGWLAQNLPFFPASPTEEQDIVEKLQPKKNTKPEKIGDAVFNLSPYKNQSMGALYSQLKTKFNLTDTEIEIISRSTSYNGWPDSLKIFDNYSRLNEFNYFKLGEFTDEYGVNGLFWVSPNQNFPNGFSPKSGIGFFFIAQINDREKKRIADAENLTFVNSPWWIKNINSSISYDASTFVFNNPSGAIASASVSSNNNNGFTTTTVNGITVAAGNLERRNKRSGVMILYFGSNRIVSNVSLFVVEIDKNNSEDGIAESLQRRVAGSSPYMYYEFKEGFDCSGAQGYLRKKGISPPSCTY